MPDVGFETVINELEADGHTPIMRTPVDDMAVDNWDPRTPGATEYNPGAFTPMPGGTAYQAPESPYQ